MKRTSGIMNFVHGCRRRATHEAVRGLLYFSKWLGPERILSLGRGLGWMADWSMRRRLAANLSGAGLEPSQKVLERYFRLMGNWAGWSLAVYQKGFMESGVGRRVHVDSTVEHLDRALAGGKGVILATAHYFCNEMAAAAVNLRHPILVLVRDSKDPMHQAIKERWYKATGMEIVHRARRTSVMADSLAYLRVLRAGRALAITPDLPMREGKGVPIQLFGRDVILPAGIIALAMRSGSPILNCWGEWIYDAHDRPTEAVVRFSEPLTIPRTGDRETDLHAGMQEWGRHFEQNLRQYPENWMFWLDKNWTRVWRSKGAAA